MCNSRHYLYYGYLSKILSIFAVKSVLMTVIVGAVALGVWYAHFAIQQILSSPHTFGDVTIIPYGHSQNNLLDHYYDSILVQKGPSTYMIRGPHLDITILGEKKGVVLDVNEVDINQVLDSTSTDTSSIEPFELPERLQILLPVKVSVGKLGFKLGDMGWSAQNILLQSTGRKSLELSADSIQGTYVQSAASLWLDVSFAKDDVIAKGKIATANDNIVLSAVAPRKDLTQLKASTNISVKDPFKWVPVEIPSSIPGITNLNINANVTTSLSKKTLQYNVTIKTHIGEFYPFLPLDAVIKLNGTPKQAKIETSFNNAEGGHIKLDGKINDKLDFDFAGEIAYMSAMFGPQMMPMDMEIQSISKSGDKIEATIETREGSVIRAHVNTQDSLKVFFAANLSAMEPWALDWVKGNVELGRNPKLIGSFQNNKLRAYLKADSIINAYHLKADSLRLQLVMDLNQSIIEFPKVTIYTPNEEFSITGDVDYHEPTLHTSWSLKQKHGGSAETTVHVGDSLIIWAKADHAEISTIPFSDIQLNDKLRGTVTGTWSHNLDSRVGEARLDIEGNVEPFTLQSYLKVREIGDTIFIDTAFAFHNSNKIAMGATFVMPNDSNPDYKPTAMLPIQLLHASVSAEDFNIPLLLEPLGDTTLASGLFNGEISFEEETGLLGNIDFKEMIFNNIPSDLFNIKQLNVSANKNKIELLANFDIMQGVWTGNTNIVVDDIFEPNRNVHLTYKSATNGTITCDAILNNDLELQGNVKLEGAWLIPETRAEIEKTDLNIELQAILREGLPGISAQIKSNNTILKYSTLPNDFPIFIRGEVKDGVLKMNEISTKNEFGDMIFATLLYDLQNMKLEAIDIGTKKYTLKMPPHTVTVKNVSSHLEDSEEQMSLIAKIPSVQYTFDDDTYGTAKLKGKSDITLNIPHTQEGQIKNKNISGNFIIDKLVYRKDLGFEITPSSLDKVLSFINNAITNLRNKEKTEAKISVSSPIDLSFHVSDSQSDSVEVISPFAAFPFTLDIWVLGTTTRPLLRGDVTNANNGFIGVKSLYEFDLNTFNISWNDVPWQHGIIDISSTQELPYCSEPDDKDKNTCPINLDIQGTITNPQPNPSSNCGTESTAAATYRNIFLGCIASESGESTDWNKLAGKAIGKVISSTANKTLGGEYIGDIDMKVMLFNNTSSDKDSSYIKVPISLDRWVKNLSLIFGYTQDQSDQRTYDQSLQFGATYTLPVFTDKEYSHKNHLNPSLSLNGMLISKQYTSNTGTESDESRIEKNIGVNYTYKFWNPCLLGIGHCETVRPPKAMRQPNDSSAVDSTAKTTKQTSSSATQTATQPATAKQTAITEAKPETQPTKEQEDKPQDKPTTQPESEPIEKPEESKSSESKTTENAK